METHSPVAVRSPGGGVTCLLHGGANSPFFSLCSSLNQGVGPHPGEATRVPLGPGVSDWGWEEAAALQAAVGCWPSCPVTLLRPRRLTLSKALVSGHFPASALPVPIPRAADSLPVRSR